MKVIKSVLLSTASVGVALGLALAPANAQTSGDQPPPITNQAEGGATGGAEIQGQGGGAGLDAQGGAGTMTQGELKPQGDLKAQGDVKAQGELKPQDQGSAGSASGELKAQSGTKMDDSAGTTGESTAGAEGKAGADTKTTAGADTKAGASSEAKVELNQEQKTEIKQFFTENTTVIQSAPKIERTAVSVSVGVAIPTHIELVPLPSAIVVDAPSDCELMYFVWGSDVVIVDDCSRRVVEIIVNVA
jgi:hypothetical protein